MNAYVMQHELAIRLACFFGVFGGMALWELAAPRRRLTVSKLLRWANNLALVALNSVLLRALFPAAAVGMAAFAARQGWGLFNYSAVPLWMAMPVSVVLLDFVIYLQHVMFHAVPLLWRLHRVHHSIEEDETNSNFAFNLSVWDRLFSTYRDQPRAGHEDMTIGISTFREIKRCVWLPGILALPFIGKVTDYAINRRRRRNGDAS